VTEEESGWTPPTAEAVLRVAPLSGTAPQGMGSFRPDYALPVAQ
jgi:hypothetical protein